MIEISPEIVAIVMLGGVVLAMMTGYPLAFAIGGVAFIMGYLLFGNHIGHLLYSRMLGMISSYIFLALPMFVYMGVLLQYSGVAEKLYTALYLWLGGLRGGLAIITVLIGTILAACVGVIGASVTMLTLVALPAMIKRGYNRSLACGSVCAGGTLGILIPPSIMLVIYGPSAGLSVGKLFFAAFIPGFILAGLYCTYIGVRALIWPQVAPAIPAEQRAALSFRKKIVMLVTSLIPASVLVLSVLGSIFFGVAPPTEAAAVGAIGATLLAVVYRKLTWQVFRKAALETLTVSCFIYIIGATAMGFVGVFFHAGCKDVVSEIILATPGGRWGAFSAIMFVVFILGFVMDWIGIIFLMVPIVSPLCPAMGFDPLWFGMMICLMLQSAFMTPPLAGALYFVKGVSAPELKITMGEIIRGVVPFVILIIVAIVLCAVFPQLILWLPSLMIK